MSRGVWGAWVVWALVGCGSSEPAPSEGGRLEVEGGGGGPASGVLEEEVDPEERERREQASFRASEALRGWSNDHYQPPLNVRAGTPSYVRGVVRDRLAHMRWWEGASAPEDGVLVEVLDAEGGPMLLTVFDPRRTLCLHGEVVGLGPNSPMNSEVVAAVGEAVRYLFQNPPAGADPTLGVPVVLVLPIELDGVDLGGVDLLDSACLGTIAGSQAFAAAYVPRDAELGWVDPEAQPRATLRLALRIAPRGEGAEVFVTLSEAGGRELFHTSRVLQ